MFKLKDRYEKEIIPQLKKEFFYKNNLAVPRVEKVVVNIGLGQAVTNPKILDQVIKDLKLITGQRAVKTSARKSIAGFKIKKGMPIGLMVTLRRKRMYDFLERLIKIALPRVRDFRGVKPRAFDGRGNYTLGIKEQIVFPEADYERATEVYGLEINIVTTTKTDKEAKRLLGLLGFPFA
jgi:large subunit ribosomal protein L5